MLEMNWYYFLPISGTPIYTTDIKSITDNIWKYYITFFDKKKKKNLN